VGEDEPFVSASRDLRTEVGRELSKGMTVDGLVYSRDSHRKARALAAELFCSAPMTAKVRSYQRFLVDFELNLGMWLESSCKAAPFTNMRCQGLACHNR
jgi:hypothetical protein